MRGLTRCPAAPGAGALATVVEPTIGIELVADLQAVDGIGTEAHAARREWIAAAGELERGIAVRVAIDAAAAPL